MAHPHVLGRARPMVFDCQSACSMRPFGFAPLPLRDYCFVVPIESWGRCMARGERADLPTELGVVLGWTEPHEFSVPGHAVNNFLGVVQ
jgi:hypothetical protein